MNNTMPQSTHIKLFTLSLVFNSLSVFGILTRCPGPLHTPRMLCTSYVSHDHVTKTLEFIYRIFLIKYAAWYSFAKPITYYGLTTIHCMIDCIICPALAPILINTYRTPSYMFVDGEYILSKEVTTQGDPLAMAMYAFGTLPLIQKLDNTAFQVWYADDSAASASLSRLQLWWKALQELGPSYGYFPNSLKTKLVIKEMHSEDACQLFEGTGIT